MVFNLSLGRATFTSWLTSIFFVIVLFSGLYGHFFKAPKNISSNFKNYQILLKPAQTLGLREVSIKNRLGKFTFTKDDDRNDSPWKMSAPRKLPVRSQVLGDIIKTLNTIKIRSVYPKDRINISNYSLDSPSLEINLTNGQNLKTTLSFGLVNPIDNSTFVTLNGQKAIYHVDNIKSNINKLDLTSFIDSRILRLSPANIRSMKIYRAQSKNNSLSFRLEKNSDDQWVGQRGRNLVQDKVNSYLTNLTSLKTSIILDEMTIKQQSEINDYLKEPQYKVKIETKDYDELTLKVSSLVRKITGLKLEKWKYFLVKSSSSDAVYILKKEHVHFFSRSENKMKTLPIRKLFY